MKLNKFAGLQGTFLSIQKSIGLLNNLDIGHRENLDFVNEKICKAVKSEEFENEDLQRLLLLLYLNTNNGFYQELKGDLKYSHLVGYIPMISKHVLARLIFSLKLEPFLYNSIIFIEGKICYELLNISEICIKMLDEFEAIDFIGNVVKAIYIKLSFSKDDTVLQFVQSLLKNYYEPSEGNITAIKKWEITKMYHFSGLVIQSLLSLLHEGLESYCKNEYQKPEGHEVFEMFKDLKDSIEIGCSSKDSMLEYCNLLISKCSTNMVAVTLDVYLHWAEIDLDNVPDTENTLQRKICEQAYLCKTALEEAKKMNVFSPQISDLINYLSSIAVKPSIDQDNKSEVDIPTIIQNIKDPDSNTTEWIKKLLQTSFKFEDDIVELLIKNIMFVDSNHRIELFKKAVEFADKTTDCPECVKQLALQTVKQEEVDCQAKLLQDFVCNYGLKKILMLNDFKEQCRDMFNKIVCDETKYKEMYSKFITLAMQDGETVIKFVIGHAVKCELQGELMADILNLLSPVCWLSTTQIENNESNLLLDCVKNMCQEVIKKPDHCKVYFSVFVDKLVKRNLMVGNTLFNNIILSVMDDNRSGIPVEVHTAGLDLLAMLVELGIKINNSVILARLVELLDKNRCYNQYFADKMTVCETIILLIDLIVNDCIDNPNKLSVDEKAWLKNEMQNHKKLNAEHLGRLFPEDDIPPEDLMDSLFYMMHRDWEEWSVLELDVAARGSISVAFSAFLAALTRSEWMKMFEVFAPDNEHFIGFFVIVSNAVSMLKNVVDFYNCVDANRESLDYCILTTDYILNQTIPSWNYIDNEGTAQVFNKFCIMIRGLSPSKQDECSLTLMNTALKLLHKICEMDSLDDSVVDVITAGIFKLKVIHVRNKVIADFVKLLSVKDISTFT